MEWGGGSQKQQLAGRYRRAHARTKQACEHEKKKNADAAGGTERPGGNERVKEVQAVGMRDRRKKRFARFYR
jgi:hypothetical protein